MTTRILGPTESRRRRRFLLAPIFLLTLVALFMAAGAQAVHDVGLFQLDKNATTLEDQAALGEDWDLICKAHQPSSTRREHASSHRYTHSRPARPPRTRARSSSTRPNRNRTTS